MRSQIVAESAGTSGADAELLALMQRREPAAFAALMRQNNRRLYRLARSIVRDENEAEDVVQETYVRALAHLDEFRGEASLATWLARIAANEALGRVRRRRPTVDLSQAENVIALPCAGSPINPESAAARREVRRVIESAVDALPAHFRTVFMLRAVEQMSIDETATLLGISTQTVKTRFHRANRLLRQTLSAEFASILDDAFPFAGPRCDALMSRVLIRLGIAPAVANSSGSTSKLWE